MSTILETTEGSNGDNVTVEVCIILSNAKGGLERDVVINLSTLDGTAIGRCIANACMGTRSTCMGI